MESVTIQGGVGVCVSTTKRGEVFINGKQIPTPKGMNTNSSTVINGRVFIGGYEYNFQKRKFERTLLAMWHLFF